MKRHFVPAIVAVLAVTVGLSLGSSRAEAQTTTPSTTGPFGGGPLNDPFTFYYAVYLPNQQLQSLRPTPLDSINDAMVQRQYFTQTNRRALYDPVSPYADTYDPLQPFSNRQTERLARVRPFAQASSTAAGRGPSLYFSRVHQYYPHLSGRPTQHRNANTGGRSGRTGGGGMGGMGGMGMGGGMGMF